MFENEFKWFLFPRQNLLNVYLQFKFRKHEVVLKQLGPDRELIQLDKQICSMSGVQPCNTVQV